MEYVKRTYVPEKIEVSLQHPKIIHHHACSARPGTRGWLKDGTIIPCSCTMRVVRTEWVKAFPNKLMKHLKFTPDSVVASA